MGTRAVKQLVAQKQKAGLVIKSGVKAGPSIRIER
jgi:hypothetical protein